MDMPVAVVLHSKLWDRYKLKLEELGCLVLRPKVEYANWFEVHARYGKLACTVEYHRGEQPLDPGWCCMVCGDGNARPMLWLSIGRHTAPESWGTEAMVVRFDLLNSNLST